MLSADLRRYSIRPDLWIDADFTDVSSGFEDLAAEVAELAPRAPGVFVLRDREAASPTARESDILYIGASADLQQRLRRMFGLVPPDSATDSRLRYALPWAFAWTIRATEVHASRLRRALLLRYEREHGRLPPLNRSI